jgi:hypothetical protein
MAPPPVPPPSVSLGRPYRPASSLSRTHGSEEGTPATPDTCYRLPEPLYSRRGRQVRPRCPRLARRVAPNGPETRSRLVASLCRSGPVTPQGDAGGSQCGTTSSFLRFGLAQSDLLIPSSRSHSTSPEPSLRLDRSPSDAPLLRLSTHSSSRSSQKKPGLHRRPGFSCASTRRRPTHMPSSIASW